MSVRIISNAKGTNQNEIGRTEYEDTSFDQRETTVDGMTFHWGPNQVRNFIDDGVGLAHAGFRAPNGDLGDAIITDTVPFGDARS